MIINREWSTMSPTERLQAVRIEMATSLACELLKWQRREAHEIGKEAVRITDVILQEVGFTGRQTEE